MPAIIISFIGFLLSVSCFSQTHSPYIPKETRHYFNWGNKSTAIVTSQYGRRKDIVMINLHNDETTSVEAAKIILAETGGLLIQIENEGERLISFQNAGREIQFDPNRIFTSTGLRVNLEKLNKKASKGATNTVKRFARFILKRVPQTPKTVIAIHNNDDGGYSIASYRRGADHGRDALKLHSNPELDPDNFFLVTGRNLFLKLKNAGYNIVLQNNKRAKDDGSLSIVYGKRKKNYVNVEAEHDKLDDQVSMLRKLVAVLH